MGEQVGTIREDSGQSAGIAKSVREPLSEIEIAPGATRIPGFAGRAGPEL